MTIYPQKKFKSNTPAITRQAEPIRLRDADCYNRRSRLDARRAVNQLIK